VERATEARRTTEIEGGAIALAHNSAKAKPVSIGGCKRNYNPPATSHSVASPVEVRICTGTDMDVDTDMTRLPKCHERLPGIGRHIQNYCLPRHVHLLIDNEGIHL
jgi:hypothetical protein